jgi:hypothetical protein
MKRLVLLALLAAGCADGKSVLTVHLTSDGTVAGIDHFELDFSEDVAPPQNVSVNVQATGSTLPPEQKFAFVFDSTVRASVTVNAVALDGNNVALSHSSDVAMIAPSQSLDLTLTLPGTGEGDGGADGSSGDGGAPDLMPPPGCPASDDGGVAVGDPCTAPAQHECYAGPAGTCGVGACRPGVQYCVDGAWGPCLGEVDPDPEVCDGRDQDCNGMTDDGLGTVSCGLGECATSVPACTAGKPTICTPKAGAAETCNGKDDNCDGAIDELGCNCVHVAPAGSDTTNDGSAGSPFLTIGKAISVAQMAGQPKIVCVASGASNPSSGTFTESVTMVDGIHVYGGYETTNWTRDPAHNICIIQPGSGAGVVFDASVTHTTIVNGFNVHGATAQPAISVVGSTGAVISGISLVNASATMPGIDIKNANSIAATPLITRSFFAFTSPGVKSTNSRPIIYGNCSTSRDANGHCNVMSACAAGFYSNSSFAGTVGVELDYSPGAVVAENDMCGQNGIVITGDAGGTLIRGNSITPYTGQSGYAIKASDCNNTSPWILDNLELNGGVDNYMGTLPQASFGINAIGGCHLRIDHNAEIAGLAANGSQSAGGIRCQRDPVSLRESRCQIVGNKITGTKGSVPAAAYGILCEDACCSRIEGNQISGGNGSPSTGLLLNRTGTLVARNTISSGCTGAGNTSVGMDSTNSFARVENNFISGGGCGGQLYGVRLHLTTGSVEPELHSNTISGGGVAGTCTGHGLWLDTVSNPPTGPRGVLRNNILLPGPCPGQGYDVYEGSANATPRVVENNDFVPGILYHPQGGTDLVISQVQSQFGASNFSNDPMLASDGIHLTDNSGVCIDHGTPTGAPHDDIDGDPRPKGSGFDVGADEH